MTSLTVTVSPDAKPLIVASTWAGGPTQDLGANRRAYTCPDGTDFVTDPAEGFTFDRAQSEHVMFALMRAGFLGELLDGPGKSA